MSARETEELNAELSERFDNREVQGRLLWQGVRNALRAHKQAENSIAVWENGKVVIVPPQEIVVPDKDDAPR